MAFSNFRLNVIGRVVLLVICIVLAIYSFGHKGWLVTPLILTALIIMAVCELIFYTERTNRDFTSFLLSVKNGDFSIQSKTDDRGSSFAEFKGALKAIIDAFQQARADKETNYIFLQTIIADLNTALICFDETGEVKLINDAAKTLLHLPYLKNVNSLRQFAPKLDEYLKELKPINNAVFELQIAGENLKLSGRAIDFNLQGSNHKLVSIQDIKTEIENKEMEAWEQLLHVLTHEIMNSITPISSLSSTLKRKADQLLDKDQEDQESIIDLSEGLNVIAKRSEGLIHFVNHYKSLITLPTPVLKIINVHDLFERILLLKQDRLNALGIRLDLKNGDLPIYIKADAEQIEQVLINLVNNAADALDQMTDPVIALSVQSAGSKTIIQVTDNGKGIDADTADRIFVPFFTTKNKGSGIGLSLCKQIMRKHGGSISIQSFAGTNTVCSLEFP